MRYTVIPNQDYTYTVSDQVFGHSEQYEHFNQASQRAAQLNQIHQSEITALERQFL